MASALPVQHGQQQWSNAYSKGINKPEMIKGIWKAIFAKGYPAASFLTSEAGTSMLNLLP